MLIFCLFHLYYVYAPRLQLSWWLYQATLRGWCWEAKRGGRKDPHAVHRCRYIANKTLWSICLETFISFPLYLDQEQRFLMRSTKPSMICPATCLPSHILATLPASAGLPSIMVFLRFAHTEGLDRELIDALSKLEKKGNQPFDIFLSETIV